MAWIDEEWPSDVGLDYIDVKQGGQLYIGTPLALTAIRGDSLGNATKKLFIKMEGN